MNNPNWQPAPHEMVPRQYGTVFPPLLKQADGTYVIDECVRRKTDGSPEYIEWLVLHPVAGMKDSDLLRLYRGTRFVPEMGKLVEQQEHLEQADR